MAIKLLNELVLGMAMRMWEYVAHVDYAPECDVPVPGIPRTGNFQFFGGIGTGIGTNWFRKKVSEPVPKKFGTEKKSRNRYRQNLVPEKSLGTSIKKI